LDTGRPGFENDVKLEYSNNPDADGAGQTGETPWDTVVCFTFRMDGIKANDQVPERKLEGAKFKLYSDKDCTDPIGKGTTDKEGRVNFDRIVAGEYYLLETKAPAGYRKIEAPLKVSLRSEDGKFSFYINDEAVKTDDENNSLTVENGLYTGSMTVINRRGSLLPGTG
ncbi:prealbumin-like fold domain-containing protein, partial [Thomasclavelia ramosa]|uniref:prealbumin-like fold domain-containing protein n=1 Tax=Thomasclavelia ramosa TaxID=1547 RepID=UPI001D020F67